VHKNRSHNNLPYFEQVLASDDFADKASQFKVYLTFLFITVNQTARIVGSLKLKNYENFVTFKIECSGGCQSVIEQ
jgi:hypothetical protein